MFDCVDNGTLNSVSVLANGVAFEHAVAGIRQRPGLRAALHLNLFERHPVARESEVGVLVGDSGEFERGFGGLWGAYARASRDEKERFRKAVVAEYSAQLGRAKDALGDKWDVEVDGHVHIDMIPFLFACLLSLMDRLVIRDNRRLP